MVSCNIRNRKGRLENEMLLIVVSIGITIVIFIVLFYLSGAAKEEIQGVDAQISHDFPALFVRAFLNMEIKLSDDEARNLGLEEDISYTVADLIIVGTDEAKSIVSEKRDEFLRLDSSQRYSIGEKDLHTLYEEYSGDSYDVSDLLLIDYSEDTIPTEVEKDNHFSYLRSSNGKYSIIYFKEVR